MCKEAFDLELSPFTLWGARNRPSASIVEVGASKEAPDNQPNLTSTPQKDSLSDIPLVVDASPCQYPTKPSERCVTAVASPDISHSN